MPAINSDVLRGLLDDSDGTLEPRIGVMLGILFVSLFGSSVLSQDERILMFCTAVSFPGVSKQVPFLRIPHIVFFIGKHFGTGMWEYYTLYS